MWHCICADVTTQIINTDSSVVSWTGLKSWGGVGSYWPNTGSSLSCPSWELVTHPAVTASTSVSEDCSQPSQPPELSLCPNKVIPANVCSHWSSQPVSATDQPIRARVGDVSYSNQTRRPTLPRPLLSVQLYNTLWKWTLGSSLIQPLSEQHLNSFNTEH